VNAAGFTRLDQDRIRLADVLLVYLERSLATPGPVPPDTLPRPYGPAPLAVGPDGVVVAPVGAGEAIWLGFQAVDRAVRVVVRVRIDAPQSIDAATGQDWTEDLSEDPRNYLVCPPDVGLAGRPVPEGRRLFGSDHLERFTVLLPGSAASVTVQLVPPDEFADVVGAPPAPLDPRAGYSGRRLP
jgi:hypothetical protein